METAFYKVETPVFEGPLDVLLSLIEKRKLLINDISLSKVADDFMAYVQKLASFPVAESANFILIASTLVLIKSKSLLPTLDLTLEEEESIGDLEKRLKIYKKIKDLSLAVSGIFGKQIIFQKLPPKNVAPVFSPEKTITLSQMLLSFRETMKNFPKKEMLPKAIVRKVVSLEETINNLTERIKTGLKMSFKNFSGIGRAERINVIISFLAMLELVKRGMITVSQENLFEDISMETENIGVPKY